MRNWHMATGPRRGSASTDGLSWIDVVTKRLPVAEAARELGERPGTLRRWVREGCPVASAGQRGRGNALLLDPEQVQRWRAANDCDHSDAKGHSALLAEFAGAIPGLVADAALEALAEASPNTQGGGELRRLREALGDAARRIEASLQHYLAGKSNGID